MAAMAMTRDAGCCRSIHKPSASATTTKVRTPLPASAQLILMRAASVSKFAECVTNHPAKVPNAPVRIRDGVRVAGTSAKTTATTAEASTAVHRISPGSKMLALSESSLSFGLGGLACPDGQRVAGGCGVLIFAVTGLLAHAGCCATCWAHQA
jgi:hypothetical protein